MTQGIPIPVQGSERYSFIDCLRGFALLGVLLANMATHSGYYFLSAEKQQSMDTYAVDHVVTWLIHFLIDGKFYSLFSLLFGIGFAIQLQRSSGGFATRFSMRLFILFIFGLLHAVFFYVGDILTVYALTGMFLLLFRNVSNKAMIVWIVIMLILPVAQYSYFWMEAKLAVNSPSDEGRPAFFDQLILTNQTGSFPEIVTNNIGGLIFGRYPDLFFTGRFFRVFAMFLLGFYVMRTVHLNDLSRHRTFLKKVLLYSSIIGIPCNLVLAMMMETNAYYGFGDLGYVQPMVYAFGVPALGLVYASGLALLFTKEKTNRMVQFFAPVGQMALTNYLMQSVICCLIFMSYGGGWYGQVGPIKLIGIATTIYLGQALFSHWWLKRYQFGPMEWLWRTLTYRRAQPMKLKLNPELTK